MVRVRFHEQLKYIVGKGPICSIHVFGAGSSLQNFHVAFHVGAELHARE